MMIYRELNATFGALSNAKLELKEGLNIVYGPNESGKSTWSAFLRAMLYGISTREQSKIGFLADKEKYKPWSGAPMYGRLRLTVDGRPVCIERTSARTGILQKATVTYEDTGLDAGIPEPPGETLLGVKKEVFERSALTPQGALAVTGDKDGELVRKITSLVQTGDDETSFSTAKARLEKWRRARKYNRSGTIPTTEEKLAQDLSELERLRAQAAVLGEQIAKKNEYQEEAAKLGELRTAWESHQAAQKLSEIRAAEKNLETAQSRVKPLPDEAKLTRVLELEHMWKEALRNQNQPMETVDVSRETISSVLLGVAVGVVSFAAVGALFGSILTWNIGLICGGFAGILAFCAGFIIGSVRKNKKLRELERLDVAQKEAAVGNAEQALASTLHELDETARIEEASVVVERIRRGAAEIHRAMSDVAVANERLSLLMRGVDLAELERKATLSGEIPPELDLEVAMQRVGFLTRAIHDLELDCTARQAALEAKGSIAELTERAVEEKKIIMTAEREYSALTLALDTLAEVNGELERRFAPVLEKKAAEILKDVTNGRFDTVDLRGTELELSVHENPSAPPRSILSLSGGTLDELYLCLRLAICDTIFEKPVPIILDDVFVNYDDTRLARMLARLKEIAKERQVILFTCHKRETLALQGDAQVNCIELG
ncbi:MAG: hypothetical protein E7471_01405 [Ruminococcaceae bacterium]|nr:hypothetical protein [Oscillospiraceae bacterium]